VLYFHFESSLHFLETVRVVGNVENGGAGYGVDTLGKANMN
jgi:hypothetical protein